MKKGFDLSYGIATLDLDAIKEAVISSVFNEKQNIYRRHRSIEDYCIEGDLLRAESDAKELKICADRLHNSLRCLHHLVEAEKREILKIVRNKDKINQFIK